VVRLASKDHRRNIRCRHRFVHSGSERLYLHRSFLNLGRSCVADFGLAKDRGWYPDDGGLSLSFGLARSRARRSPLWRIPRTGSDDSSERKEGRSELHGDGIGRGCV